MDNYTDIEIIKQWLDAHWTDVLKYYGAKMKDAANVETISWNTSRAQNIVGMLCTFVEDGVQKIVNVTPNTLINALSGLSSELATQCRNAMNLANTAANSANTAAAYANREGDKVAALIIEINTLKTKVAQQGNTAESQGNFAQLMGENAQRIYDLVNDWYPGFKEEATAWYNNATLAETTRNTNEETRNSNETTRQSRETVRVSNENTRQSNETARVSNETLRQRQESARQQAEALRQTTFDTNETQRQTTFDTNEAQRQQDFEDAEAERMERMLLTRFEIDQETGCLMAYMTESDPTNYFIRNGYMMAEIVI